MSRETKKQRTLKWEVKDSMRCWWYIKADYRRTEDAEDEPGFYRSLWDISIMSEGKKPDFQFRFSATTQYDLDIDLNDIWAKQQEYMTTLTLAMLSEHGYAMGKRASPS